jgi:hypothetical protein
MKKATFKTGEVATIAGLVLVGGLAGGYALPHPQTKASSLLECGTWDRKDAKINDIQKTWWSTGWSTDPAMAKVTHTKELVETFKVTCERHTELNVEEGTK